MLKPGGRLIIEDLVMHGSATELERNAISKRQAETKLEKLKRVVCFEEELTLESYKNYLLTAGFCNASDSQPMVVSASPVWKKFTRDRTVAFSKFCGDTKLEELGIHTEGTLASALENSGIYHVNTDWPKDKDGKRASGKFMLHKHHTITC